METDESLAERIITIHAFIRDEVIPLEPVLLRQGFRAVLPALEEARQRVKSLGLWAPGMPPEYGGLGLHLREFARVSEELGRSPRD